MLLLFTSAFPYGKGEQFLETEIIFLANKFTHIVIFPCSYGGRKEKRNTPKNVKVYQPIIQSKIKRLMNFNFFSTIKKKKHLSSIFDDFIKALKSGNVKKFILSFNLSYYCLSNACLLSALKKTESSDILYFYWGNGISNIIPFMEEVKGKIVLRLHGGDLYEDLYNNYIPFRKEQLIRSDSIVTISESGLSYLIDIYPFVKKKISLYRLGIKPNELQVSKNSKVFHIVSCSSIIPVKRLELIVDILKNMNDLNIKWTHIGDGFLRESLEEKIKALSANIEVELKGVMDNKNVLEFYRTTWVDFFINVSESEGIPVSIMEASSFGIPSIATDVGGTSEIINKDTGFLLEKYFDPADASKLLKASLLGEKNIDRKEVFNKWNSDFNADINYPIFMNFLLSLSLEK